MDNFTIYFVVIGTILAIILGVNFSYGWFDIIDVFKFIARVLKLIINGIYNAFQKEEK